MWTLCFEHDATITIAQRVRTQHALIAPAFKGAKSNPELAKEAIKVKVAEMAAMAFGDGGKVASEWFDQFDVRMAAYCTDGPNFELYNCSRTRYKSQDQGGLIAHTDVQHGYHG